MLSTGGGDVVAWWVGEHAGAGGSLDMEGSVMRASALLSYNVAELSVYSAVL